MFKSARLELSLYRYNLLTGQQTVALTPHPNGFSKSLEQGLLTLCKDLNVPIPLWLSKNTTEFAQFHQTLFFPEQFDEPVAFDRMRLRLLTEADD